MLHEQRAEQHSVPFSYFLESTHGVPNTPEELVRLGLYKELAVPVFGGEHLEGSAHLMLQALRAKGPWQLPRGEVLSRFFNLRQRSADGAPCQSAHSLAPAMRPRVTSRWSFCMNECMSQWSRASGARVSASAQMDHLVPSLASIPSEHSCCSAGSGKVGPARSLGKAGHVPSPAHRLLKSGMRLGRRKPPPQVIEGPGHAELGVRLHSQSGPETGLTKLNTPRQV